MAIGASYEDDYAEMCAEIDRLRAELAQVREILGDRENTITRLRAQHDRMLAALKDTLGALDAEFGQQVVDINFKLLRAAIAAVEEKP